MWLTSIIVLVGAELNAEIEQGEAEAAPLQSPASVG